MILKFIQKILISKPKKTEPTVTVKKEVKKEITANTKDNDEWESF